MTRINPAVLMVAGLLGVVALLCFVSAPSKQKRIETTGSNITIYLYEAEWQLLQKGQLQIIVKYNTNGGTYRP